MQYQLAFCFWLLTFEDQIASEINACVSSMHSASPPLPPSLLFSSCTCPH